MPQGSCGFSIRWGSDPVGPIGLVQSGASSKNIWDGKISNTRSYLDPQGEICGEPPLPV